MSGCAILFFSRSWATEAVAKPLGITDTGRAERIIRTMMEDVLTVLSGVDADLHWWSDVPIESDVLLRHGIHTNECQRGADQRERLKNAVDDLFARGYAQVCIVGNDTPLSRDIVENVLDADTDVIGHSWDGGFYILKLMRDSPAAALFDAERWNGGRPDVADLNLSVVEARLDFDMAGTILRAHPDKYLRGLADGADHVVYGRPRHIVPPLLAVVDGIDGRAPPSVRHR